MAPEYTRQDVLRQLEQNLGTREGMKMYEWYCKTYGIDASCTAPEDIRYEVFGG